MSQHSPVLCNRVIEAIGDQEGCDATELGYRLYEYIDPGVLDRLERREDGDWTLEFRVADHTVVVNNDRKLTVNGEEYSWK